MKNVDTVESHSLKKKIIIVIGVIAIIVIILVSVLTRNKIKNAEKIRAEKEIENKVQLNVEIKKETETAYECLLTFISNDENDKIKSIQYPEEGQEPYTIYNKGDKKEIAIDYKINKGDEVKVFKIATMQGEEYKKKTGYTIIFDGNGGTIQGEEKNRINGYDVDIESTISEKEGYEFYGWSKNKNDVISMYENGKYFYEKDDESSDVKLYAVFRKKINLSDKDLLNATKDINETCQANIIIKDEEYETDFVNYDGNLTLDGENEVSGAVLNNNVYEFGTRRIDVATKEKYAKNMVIIKVNGDLTINNGVTLTACKSDNGYGGPKGLLIYCTGTISNNGTIDMTARGAKAVGQNIYLWQNIDNNYEYIPGVGANGGARKMNGIGNSGKDGINRQTGGGGSGGGRYWNNNGIGGAGALGTSYSGGPGGGRRNRNFGLQ